MRHKFVFSFLLLLLGLSLAAQNPVTVSGTVKDEAGDTVIGAGVVQEGTGNGTTTDVDGRYSITVPLGSRLQFSCIGYKKDGQNFTISGGSATIENSVLGLNIVLSDVVSAAGETQGTASPVSFLMLSEETINSDADPTDGVFTYTHASEAKEGYAEHSIAIYFSNDKLFLNLLVAVADGSPFAGENIFMPVSYTVTTADQWNADPKGQACPGFNFLGLMDLGCYYTTNGTVNYLTKGVVRLVENADGLVVSIVDAEGNAIEGLPASLALLAATKKAE